jgi:carbamoylphosphate synthase large subunit
MTPSPQSRRATAPARRVLVTGVGGPSGRAAFAALRSRGYEVIGCDSEQLEPDGLAFVRVPRARDPGFLAALTRIIQDYQVSWLFPTVSEELPVIATRAATLRALGLAVFIGAPQAVIICDDKWRTAMWLAAHRVAVPRSTIAGPADHAALGFAFPLISRPRVGRGGRGVVVHDGPGTPAAAPDVLWQEFLPGDEYDVLLLMDPRRPHDLLFSRTLRKTALRDGRTGNAIAAEEVEAHGVTRLAVEACRAVGIAGPADIDVRCNEFGVPHVIEINARIGALAGSAPGFFDRLVELHQHGERG